ncbi:ABC transporter ATP-binding protein [Bacillaceae bacterium SIJ1]|uniref:ABC transporter ATP-binding protein n=1 Tax=Litoribacterium kuwaitense TaxID=1398745 RepID=UPI0013EE2693|nr:ABC transporter ATP-binding protein [Litoribacterium kuwaitense]NGP46475.1 ABC transporter ATP-binding protein [Litoribacterium kuwaitense]
MKIVLKSIKTLWRASPTYLVIAFAVAIVGGLIPTGELYLFKLVLDMFEHFAAEREVNASLFIILFGFVFMKSVRMVTETVGQSAQRVLAELTSHDMRTSVFEKTMKEPYWKFDRPEYFDQIRRVSNEVESRPLHLVNALFFMIEAMISLVGVIVLLSFISPLLVMFILMAAIPYGIVRIKFEEALWGHRWRNSEPLRRLDYLGGLMTSKEGAGEIRLYQTKKFLLNQFESTWESFFSSYQSVIRKYALRISLVILPAALLLGVTYFIVARMVANRGTSLGDIGVVLTSIDRLYESSFTLCIFGGQVMENVNFLRDYFKYTESHDRNALATSRVHTKKLGQNIDITFENVSFKYPGKEQWAVQNLSFVIPHQASVAIVGENGSGKSTILKLICGLYQPAEGRILFGGVDIRDLDPQDIWQYVGMLFQDFVRYQFTVSENVRFEAEGTEEKVKQVLKQSGAAAFVDSLDQTVNAQLGTMFTGGVELSGGEWQRIAIARELYKGANVMMLDEPTAALDPRAEHELFEHLGNMLSGKTAIFTTHRFGMIRWADHILVMKKGQLIEQGNHDILMKKKGVYADLYTLQAEKYVRNETP